MLKKVPLSKQYSQIKKQFIPKLSKATAPHDTVSYTGASNNMPPYIPKTENGKKPSVEYGAGETSETPVNWREKKPIKTIDESGIINNKELGMGDGSSGMELVVNADNEAAEKAAAEKHAAIVKQIELISDTEEVKKFLEIARAIETRPNCASTPHTNLPIETYACQFNKNKQCYSRPSLKTIALAWVKGFDEKTPGVLERLVDIGTHIMFSNQKRGLCIPDVELPHIETAFKAVAKILAK